MGTEQTRLGKYQLRNSNYGLNQRSLSPLFCVLIGLYAKLLLLLLLLLIMRPKAQALGGASTDHLILVATGARKICRLFLQIGRTVPAG